MAAAKIKQDTEGTGAEEESALERYEESVETSEPEAQASDEDEEDDESVILPETPDEPSRRQKKKRQRSQNHSEIRAENERLQQQLREQGERMARLEGFVSAQPRQEQQPGQPDPYQRAYAQLDQEEDNLYAQYDQLGANVTPEQAKYFRQQHRMLQWKRTQVAVLQGRNMGQSQQTDGVSEDKVRQTILREKYSDVWNNPRARQYAMGQFAILQSEGYQDDPGGETLDIAMQRTREHFGFGGARRPTQNRRRLTGISSRGAGGGEISKKAVDMTDPLNQEMAEALYSDLPKREAWKRWAKNAGRKLVNAKA